MQKRNTVVFCAALGLLLLFVWAGWANWSWRQQQSKQLPAQSAESSGENPYASSPLIGKVAPAFTLENVEGRKVTLTDFHGKAVLINFWATWCGPCRIETPWLIELRNQYASQGFEVIGISAEGEDLKPGNKAGLERQRTAVKEFVAKMKMPYPVLIDGDSLTQAYGGIDAMPTSFYVDKKGVVVAAQMGLTSKAEIEANIRKALGQ